MKAYAPIIQDDKPWHIGLTCKGYYWPTMKQDVKSYARRYDWCQRQAPIPCAPLGMLNPVTSPWSFAQWEMDIIDHLPITTVQKKFLLLATDYFSKWVEAEAYANIKGKDVSKFVWKNIVCRFGFPRALVANNGPLFDRILFRTFCSELNIKNLYSTPHYPQSNEQANAKNKTLLSALKKMLKKGKGKWVDELPGVLWAYQTTSRRPIRATPFSLAYGMEAIIPTKIDMPTARKTVQDQRGNDEELIR